MRFNFNKNLMRCINAARRPVIFFVAGWMIAVPLVVSAGDTNKANVDVTATIISAACQINLDPATSLSFGVDSATLKTGTVSDTHKVTLTLSGCGLGYVTQQPIVTLSGSHPDSSDVPPGTDPAKIFKDVSDAPNNTAEGFWVVVSQDETPETNDLIEEGGKVLIGAATDSNGYTSPIYIGVSCMSGSPCGKQGGSLKATLRFTFKYQ